MDSNIFGNTIFLGGMCFALDADLIHCQPGVGLQGFGKTGKNRLLMAFNRFFHLAIRLDRLLFIARSRGHAVIG